MNKLNIRKPRLILSGLLVMAFVAVTVLKYNVFAATPNTLEVETVDELTTAIDTASDGDTIILNTWLNITESMTIGDDAKHLTIKKGSQDAHFNFMGNSEITAKNMTFDGDNMKTYDPWLHINSASVNVMGCTFQNMGEKENESNQYASSGAVLVRNGSVVFSDCTFRSNSGFCGNIEVMENTTATLTNCIISGGYAFEKGGAISNQGSLILNNSLIYGNTAKTSGNDIYTTGSLVRNTTIDEMTALLNDSTKVIDGWKDEGTDEIIEPTSEINSTASLTLVLSDAPPEEPDPGTDNPGDDPGNTEGGEGDSGASDASGEQSDTGNNSGGDSGSGTGTGATDEGSGSSTNTEPTTPSTTTPGAVSVPPSGSTNSPTNTQNATNSPQNTAKDQQSPQSTTQSPTSTTSNDNRTSDSHNTADNSDRSDNSRVTNNTTNNYYQDTKPSTGQQTGQPSGQATGQASGQPSGVVLAANPSGGQNGGSYSSGVNSLADNKKASGSAYMKATDKEETDTDTQTDEKPTQEQANNFDIDLSDANISIKANGSGGYDVVVRDAKNDDQKNPVTESTASQFLVWDGLQIGLLAAIFLCQIWDRKKAK